MKNVNLNEEDMANRVARFKDLVPYKTSIMDGTGIPEEAVEIVSAKSVYPIMSPVGWEGRSAVAPVKGMDGLTVTIAECPPGNHPGLHSHSHTVENFFCIQGSFDITWGDNGEHSIRLEPMDFISVPPGVYREFTNVGNDLGRLFVAIQSPPGEQHDTVIHSAAAGEEIESRWGKDARDAMAGIGIKFGE